MLDGRAEFELDGDRGRGACGSLFFNPACCESLTGSTADTIDHLRRAIELADEFRGFAKDDPDLAALAGDPAFRELTGG